MNRLPRPLTSLNPLSCFILQSGIRLSLLMLAITKYLTYLIRSSIVLNTMLLSCRRIYPLLTLMVLTISVVGSLLIDVYFKTQNR